MKVRELLEQLAPTLETHEVVTGANYPTKLIVSIEQKRAIFTGEYSNTDFARSCHPEITIEYPFEHSVYVTGQGKEIPVMDLGVYRWCFQRVNDEIWKMKIETKEAR